MPCRYRGSTRERTKRRYSRIWLGHHVTTFWCHHDSLTYSRASGIVDRFQKASRNSRRSLYAWFIVELTIVVCWTVLYPVASNRNQTFIACYATQAPTFLPTTVAYVTRREWFLGLLVIWSERFASTTEACSTRISVDACLAGELKYGHLISTVSSY
jgi:hypothetical protein